MKPSDELKLKIESFDVNGYGVAKHENKVVFDLYSGTGTIGQVMAKAAKKVYGIEIIEEAVVAANQNAKLNGLTNPGTEFF